MRIAVPRRERFERVTKGAVIPHTKAASAAKWALDKTDHSVVAAIGYDRLEVDYIETEVVQDIIRAAMNQVHVSMLWNDEIDRVVVGRDVMHKIECNIDYAFSFRAEERLGNGDARRMCGYKVQIVPWFEGILVLPKL